MSECRTGLPSWSGSRLRSINQHMVPGAILWRLALDDFTTFFRTQVALTLTPVHDCRLRAATGAVIFYIALLGGFILREDSFLTDKNNRVARPSRKELAAVFVYMNEKTFNTLEKMMMLRPLTGTGGRLK